jgi:hypothetical protein
MARVKTRAKSKAEIYRAWGIPEHLIKAGGLRSLMRYQTPVEKGIYWYYLARYVRQRDVDEWGTCISCDNPITFEVAQAGHFMPAFDCGRDLLFDERNVNAECSRCNAFDETHLLGYAENLDRRYGEGTALTLRERRQAYKASKEPIKDWKAPVYEEKLRVLLDKMDIVVPSILST